jgi:lipopolysaccharide export system protein LptC
MNEVRATRRFRLAIVMTLMIALALGSFWILEVVRRESADRFPSSPRDEPDFYVEKFSYVKLSKTVKGRYHISGQRLLHNPQGDSYDIQLPVINNKSSATEAPMTIRAERAHVDGENNSNVHLYGNVHLDRPAAPGSEALKVISEYMLVLPQEDVVKTDLPVEITMGRSRLSGTGMYANNATREFRLSGNVHGMYQARSR